MIILVKNQKLLKDAERTLKLLYKRNNWSHKNLQIILDYSLKDFGQFDFDKSNTIIANPDNCNLHGDYSLYSILIHEIAHLIDNKLKIYVKFIKLFSDKKNRIFLNANSKLDRREELAEIIALYIQNPYLLKLINSQIYSFIKSQFISPTPYSMQRFIKSYEFMPIKTKNYYKKHYNIYVDKNTIYYQK